VVGGTLVDERTYGGTVVTFYARASEPGEAAKSTVSG
jgi:hypothetical protein